MARHVNLQRESRWFAAFAVFGILTAFLTCFLPAPSLAAEFTAKHIGDFGNVSVLEVSGNYDAELPDRTVNFEPREAIAREFYRTHKDEYDFLVIFSNFDFKMPASEVVGFYLGVKNDTKGIGKDLFDYTASFGSAGKLQGTIDMGNLANNVADPLDPAFEHTLGTLNHEILHRWGAHLKFRDHNGQTSTALIGKDGAHWSYLLDTKGSLHYGGGWLDNGNGTFTATETRTYFSPLDLYVMGMIDKSEVPPMVLIENPDLDPTQIPTVGTTITGTARTVTIDDIIAVEGERIPSAADAQKSFKTAFLYVTAPGTFDSTDPDKITDLYRIESIRNGFLPRFSILTDGQGLVQVASTPKEDLPTNPGTTPVNPGPPRTLPPSIDEGVAWLLGNQKPDGSWLEAEPTRRRDTAEAVIALKTFGVSGGAIDLGMTWLSGGGLDNTDNLARRIEAGLKAGVDVGPLLTDLLSRQNADGGWGLSRYFFSNPSDTALALKALGRASHGGPAVAKAVTYLTGHQNADGGWSESGAASLIQPTAHTLLALNSYRNSFSLEEPIVLGGAFLQQRQNVDGGFGNSPSTIYDSAAALIALNEIGISSNLARTGVDYLLARQVVNGSWNDSPYQTAMAVQAVYQATVLPDLAVSSAGISVIPEKIVKLPTNAVISVEMTNFGRTAVPQAVVALYDGSGDEAVRIDEQVVAFPAESSVVVTFSVPVPDARDYLFTVVVDPDHLVEEQSVANNRAGKFLGPEPTYDFVLEADQLTVTPNPVGIFENVKVGATVRNAGTSDAFNVPVRFFIEDGADTIQIATKTVDIRANGSATVEAVWQAGKAGALTVVAEVDPANVFAETDETNNRVSQPLSVNSSTLPNLNIAFDDLVVAPNPARQGGMATIAPVVRNTGFSAAEQVTATVYLGVPGGEFVPLGSHTIPRLDPGQSEGFTVQWENIPDFGSRIILVRIDPDNLIAEIRKDDNEAFLTLPILSLPDLVLGPGAIEISPATPTEGDEVAVHITIINAGDQEARDVAVNLYESSQLLSTRIIPIIEGQSQAKVSFAYDSIERDGVHELRVVVDPDNLIRELREDNNSASKTFTIQNADLWVSERFISPNGDGVKDETRFGFRLDAPATVTVNVVNADGDAVRSFHGPELTETTGATLTWDGLGDGGTVVDDGVYRFEIRGAGGSVLGSIPVVVDNDRSPLIKALGTKYLLNENLTCSLPYLSSDEWEWFPDESGLLFFLRSDDTASGYPSGIYSMSPNGEDIRSLVPYEWSHSSDPKYWHQIGNYKLSPDGGTLAVLWERRMRKGGATSFELWTLDRDGGNLKLLEAGEGYGGEISWAPDSSKIAYTSGSYTSGYTIWVVRADGTEKRQIDTAPTYYVDGIKWDNKSSSIAYAYHVDDQVVRTLKLRVADLAGSVKEVFSEEIYIWGGAISFEWVSKDEITVSYHRDMEANFNRVKSQIIVDVSGSGSYFTLSDQATGIFAVNPTGGSVVFVTRDDREFIRLYDGSNNLKILHDAWHYPGNNWQENITDLRWSRDGKKLAVYDAAYEEVQDCDYNGHLVVIDLGSGQKSAFKVSDRQGLCWIPSSYHVRTEQDGAWLDRGVLHYDSTYQTKELDLRDYLKEENGLYTLRIAQIGMDEAYIDVAALRVGGRLYRPVKAVNLDTGKDILAKVLAADNDVADAHDAVLELSWEAVPRTGPISLVLNANETDFDRREVLPFRYPRSGYHTVTLEKTGGILFDGEITAADDLPQPLFREYSRPVTGHPDGYVYGYVKSDGEYLYATLDFTVDNTLGEEDWAELEIGTAAGSKTYRIKTVGSQPWGKTAFTRTGNVPYQHNVYEFKIPLEEIGAKEGDTVSIAFGAYGTAATGPGVSYRGGLDWFHGNATLIAEDDMGIFSLDTGTGAKTYFPIDGSLAGLSPLGRYVNYDQVVDQSSPCYGYGWQDLWSMSSALNLVADLRVLREKSSVTLKGVAADLNFAGYKLEYADAASPDVWNLVQPPSDNPVFNATFATWVPPYAGTFHVRLTVWDKAGNVTWDRKRVTWGLSSKITNLYKTEEIISPNDDGIKDTVQLHYRVMDSVQLTFSIYDADQRLVRTFDKAYTAPGSDFITWDGRDDYGGVVPDGIYRINVAGFDFFVEVDTTSPAVKVALAPLDPDKLTVTLSGLAHDSNLRNWRVEYGKGVNPDNWLSLAEGQKPLALRDSKGNLVVDPLQETPVWKIDVDEIARFAGHRFRMVAEDRAGNVSSALSELLEEQIRLFKWNGDSVSGTVPGKLLGSGLQHITGFHTYRLPFIDYALQYRIGTEWRDAAADIGSQGGLIHLEWNNTPVAEDFNAVRLRAVDESGKVHFSNVLTAGKLFYIETTCEPAIWGYNYLFEDLQALKFQYQAPGGALIDYADADDIGGSLAFGPSSNRFAIPFPPEPGIVRMKGIGMSGREYLSDAVSFPPDCGGGAPEVTLEIEYPVGGTCGGIGESATITAQVKRGRKFSTSLSIFLEKDEGELLLGGFENSLSGSVNLNTAEMTEGTIPVRAEFSYDLAEGIAKYTGRATLVADRTLPTAQITYPAGDSLVLCPITVSDAEGAWHGLPVEAIVLDNHAVRRYELRYGAGENPSAWRPAMTRQGKYRKQIAGEGPVKGRIGVWDLAGLQGTVYTLKLIVVDVAGNTSCHTATAAVDTLLNINGLSLDRKIFSPLGEDLLGGFSIDEAALIDIEVFPLSRNPDKTFRLGDAPVRILESGKYHSGGSESFAWDGHDDAGAVVPDGDYALAVRATDSCGNSSLRWVPVVVDGTPPAVAISYPTPGSPLGTILEVKGSVSDQHFAGYTLETGQEGDPDSWRPIAMKSTSVDNGILGVWNTFGLEGAWSLRLSAKDQAGNESHTEVALDLENRTSIIRSLQAEPRIFSPNGDGNLDQTTILYDLTASSQIAIEIFDKDGLQVRSQEFSAVPEGFSTFPWDGKDSLGAVVPDGEYRLRLTATLIASPDFYQVEEVTVFVDNTPPTINLVEPVEEAFLNVADLAFTGTVRDKNLLEYAAELTGPGESRQLDGGNQNRIEYTFGVLRELEEGSYTLSFEAADLAGNATSISRSFTIDRTAPQVRLDAPENGKLLGSSDTLVPISGEIVEENPAAFTLRYGTGENPTEWVELIAGEGLPGMQELYSWAIDAQSGLPDGDYTLSLHAVDRAGLEGEARVKVTIDRTPPEVSIAFPAEGAYLTGPTEIKGTAFDVNFEQAAVSLAEGSCSEAYKWAPLRNLSGPVKDGVLYGWQSLPRDGEYCLRLEAKDKVGNESLLVREVRIDTLSPNPPVLTGEFVEKDSLRLEWTANEEDDLAGYNLYRNGQPVNTTLLSETTWLDENLVEGTYLYVVKAVDFAGNESDPSNEVKRRVDLTPPSVNIASPANGARLSNFADIKGGAHSADDFKEYRVLIGAGEAPATWELLRRSPLPINFGLLARWDLISVAEGIYTIRLEGEDLSGNIAHRQVTVTVDNLPPQAPNLVSAVATGADAAIEWQPVDDADLAGYLLYRNHQLVNVAGLVIGDLTPYLLSGTSYADSNLPDGVFEYYVQAMDQAGNLSDPSNARSVTIDTRVPQATVVEPLDGEKFEGPFTILAECPDEDIASIRLQYRESDSSTWLDIGEPVSSPPYAGFFDPQALGLAYGTYHLRAVATDLGGKTDPSPATIAVIYVDLTPPDAPKGLKAVNQGSDIQLTWAANTETDLAGYNIYRTTGTLKTKLNSDPITGEQYLHANLVDGEYVYAITAVDLYGNESEASEPAGARIYAPYLTSPIGMTAQDRIGISGSGAEPGSTVEIYAQTPSGLVIAGSSPATATGEFTVEGVALSVGDNSLVARAIDSGGGWSKYSAPLNLFRGEIPQAPTGLSGTAEDYTVQLGWNPNPEAEQVIGYYLFRDGERIDDESIEVTGSPTASSTYSSYAPSRAVDGSISTYWQSSTSNNAKSPVWFELAWPQTGVVRRLEINWGYYYFLAGRDFQVQGWTGNAWVTLASVIGNTQTISPIDLTQAMVTNRLRIHVNGFNSSYGSVRIAELGVFRDSLIEEPAFTDDQGLTDGEYRYQVTAVNRFGFESLPSPECPVVVGDVIPPAAPENLIARAVGSGVELDWSLTPNAEPDLAGFNVYRQSTEGWQKINSEPIPGTYFVDTNLPNGVHAYRITAVDLAGNESDPSAPAQATVAVEPPEPPVILGIVPLPEGKALSIEWQAAPEATFYNLYRSEEPGGPYSRVNGDALEALSFVDSELVNGREYLYVLTALDLAGNESVYSAEVRGVPEDLLPPEMPTWLFPARGGEQVVLDRNSVSFTGYAEPGAVVEVFRNGISIGATSALGAESIQFKGALPNGSGAIPSPDGTKIAFRDSSGALWVKDLATGEERRILQQQVFSPVWAPDGSRIVYYSAGRVADVELDSGIITFASADATASERDPSWSEDGSRLVFVSNSGGSWGVWVKDLSSDTLTRVVQGSSIYLPKFSPDGEKIAYRSSSGLYYLDLEEQTPIRVDDNADIFSWSPDSGKLAYRSYINSRYAISVFTLNGGEKTPITDSTQLENFPVFSPDGNAIAFVRRETGSLSSLYLSSLSGESRRILSDIDGLQYLAWRRSGQLVLMDGSGVHEIYPQGTFQLEGVDLYRGENHFYAIATDQAGNQGPSSEVMTVVFDNSRLPDLSVTSDDIYLYPLSPGTDEEVAVNAVVHNVSATPAVSVPVDLYLWDAAGELKLIGSEVVPSLPGHGEVSVSATFRTGSVGGKHTAIVVVDPENLIGETRESNNTALKEFLVGDEERLELTAGLDALFYPSRQAVAVDVTLMNGGPAQVLTLEMAVEDELGRPVAELATQTVNLSFGSVENFKPQWNTGATFAGNYRLRVKAENSSGILAEQLVPFGILPDVTVSARVGTGKRVFGADENVPVGIDLKNTGVNNILRPVTVNTTIVDSGDEIVFQAEQNISSLWPGMESSLKEEWHTGARPPGEYRVKADIFVGTTLIETASTTFDIAPEATVSGQLTLEPAVVLSGKQVRTSFTLQNDGNADISGNVQILVLEPKSFEILKVEELPLTLQQGVPQSGEVAFSTDGLGLQSYSVVLKFIGENVQKTVASAPFSVKDGTPPVITVLSPTEGESYETAISLSITAVDRLSGLARVQCRIDDGAWQNLPLADPATGQYSLLWEPAQNEGGVHAVRFRAEDHAGNIAETEAITFTFEVRTDRTPPVTEISLIGPTFTREDGSVFISGETTLELIATDDDSGVARTEFRLDDGEWFPAATFTIATAGEHLIEYRSTDHHGNVEEPKVLTVTVDNTAPVTSIAFENQSFIDGDKLLLTIASQVILTATDDLSGVAWTYYRFDEETDWRPYTESLHITDLPFGSHVMHFYSDDHVDNAEAPQSVSFTLVGAEVKIELLNRPRVLVWTDDPGDKKGGHGHGAASYSLDDIRNLVAQAMDGADAYVELVTKEEDFRENFRSGIFNVVMVLSQDEKLDSNFLRELRDAVEQGRIGLLVSSWGNNVHPVLQDMFGVHFVGSMSMNEEQRELHLFDSEVARQAVLQAYGRILKTRLDGGTLAGMIPGESRCQGVRSVGFAYPETLQAGDRVTLSVYTEKSGHPWKDKDKEKLNLVDQEQMTVDALPSEGVNNYTGNPAGDLAITSADAGALSFTLAGPYGYLGSDYLLEVRIEHSDGTVVESELVPLTPTCDAHLWAGMNIGPFKVTAVDDNRVQISPDLPAVVLNQFGEGRTVFLAYDILESALKDNSGTHAGLLGNSANYLAPESTGVEPAGIGLIQTTVSFEGAGSNLLAIDTLASGLTHLSLFGLKEPPLEYRFSLEEGTQATYRYFVRFPDTIGDYAKKTELFLELDGTAVAYDTYEHVFTVATDSTELLRQAMLMVEDLQTQHPHARWFLNKIQSDLEAVKTLRKTTKSDYEKVISEVDQVIGLVKKLPFDTDGLLDLLGRYRRIMQALQIKAADDSHGGGHGHGWWRPKKREFYGPVFIDLHKRQQQPCFWR
jgi:Tol biopolymer transport system component/flagellar hook assembly protein FlgD/fibronectin type 3 domain-containing protein